jgi:uncharacterized protein (TIGR02118 family)
VRCITVLYPNSPGARFDFDYYLRHHKTLIERLYGAGIGRYDVRRGILSPDGQAPTYIAVIAIWIGSQEVFDDAAARHAPTVVADLPNFTNVQPLIQFDEAL